MQVYHDVFVFDAFQVTHLATCMLCCAVLCSGDLTGAAVAADAARKADLADRYTNSMAVKALFAAGQVEAAEQTAMLFTRDGDQVTGDPGVGAAAQ